MLKFIPFLLVLGMAGIAYYSRQHRRRIQRQLSELAQLGIDTSYQLESRPTVVFDDKKDRIYLAHADRIEKIDVGNIREVVIFRAQLNTGVTRQENKVSSNGQIIDKQGVIYRFHDYDTPEQAVKFFRDILSLSKQVRLVNTK